MPHLSKKPVTEEDVVRLVSELVQSQHAGDCVLCRIEMRGEGRELLGIIDFDPRTIASAPSDVLTSLPLVRYAACE